MENINMQVIYLDECNTEEQVLSKLDELENVVIEAITSQRGKRQKIAGAQMQVEQLMKKCGIKRWDAAKKQIHRMFDALESASAEYRVNMWGL